MIIRSTEARLERAETKIWQLQKKLFTVQQETNLWRRIANRLYDVYNNPEATDEDRAYAIEEYLNYATPDDDDE